MSQTSFLLSGVQHNKAPLGEGKGVMSPDVPESEGDGFSSQLAQLVSGQDETAVAEGEATNKEAISKVLAEAQSGYEAEDGESLALEGDMLHAVGDHIAMSAENGDLIEASDRKQAAKQNGEVLLQRLNASSQALQADSDDVLLADETGDADGKSLPLHTVNGGVGMAQQTLPSQAVSASADASGVMSGQDITALLSKPASMLTDEEKVLVQQILAQLDAGPASISSGDNESGLMPLGDAELIAAVNALGASVASEHSGVAAVSGNKSRQDMMQAQLAATTMGGEPEKMLAEHQAKGLAPAGQVNMSQTASAVQAAVNPQTQTATPMSAYAAIPWTPAAVQNGASQSQQAASQAMLEATAAQQVAETALRGSEAKTDSLAQQLASSLGQTGSTTAAKLDAAAAQTPLQMSQNQAEAANALSERVNMMMSKNLKHVDIRLDPPELGRLQIRLSVNQDQASVQFTVANQAARDLVEQSMPRLREMMQQQGLQLAQSSVQQQDAGGRQSFAGNQTPSGDGQGGQNGQGGASRIPHGDDKDTDHGVLNHEVYVNTSKDRVDYYA